MTESFTLGRLPRIAFGEGRVAELPAIVASHGRRALLVTGRSSFRRSATWPALLTGLDAAGVTVAGDLVVDGEPSPEIVEEAVARFRAADVEVVVGIGGGSVLDAAKAIAGLLRAETTAMDHLEGVGRGLPYRGPAVPFVAVPTTAGTGSEATRNAVLSRVGPDGFKKSFRDEQLVARDAVVDPALLAGLGPTAIASNGLDALTQLLESLVSTRSFALSRALALDGLAAARDGLVPWYEAVAGGGDAPGARSRMAYAALLSGICLAHTGLGAVHGLASPLGARHPIGHGAACGATLVAVTRVNLAALEARDPDGPALGRYAAAGRVLSGTPGLDDGDARAALVDVLADWGRRLAVRGLATFGVGEADFPPLVADARGTSMRTNPIELTDAEVAAILSASL
ncbi:MAG TPA: iron-containing alcohol dehydrogenase [Candidatus Limnocylindrales bacterium]|nr:iron-containing alcohol dehydrogenase [Candidatus Limnocylindrales bacterium]